jgi:hypothetical protein
VVDRLMAVEHSIEKFTLLTIRSIYSTRTFFCIA